MTIELTEAQAARLADVLKRKVRQLRCRATHKENRARYAGFEAARDEALQCRNQAEVLAVILAQLPSP
jgi:hypothetical protein